MKPDVPNAVTMNCPDPETLVRWLDGELDTLEREALEAHRDGCQACADRVAVLETRVADISAWLSSHDFPAPDSGAYDLRIRSRRYRAGLRWLMVAASVVAIGVAAGPARAWLFARLGFGGAPTPQALAPLQGPTTVTAFVPHGAVVTVVFDAGVGGRTLSVSRSSDMRASLNAATSSDEVVVGPDGFDVHDANRPPRAYRLLVPSTVTTVRVRVNGADDVEVHPTRSVSVVKIPAGGR